MVLKLFNSYSATYGPISMKLCMLLRRVMRHMLINFCENFEFSFRIYMILGAFCPIPFVNDPVKANQKQKFYFFSIIIYLESPENSIGQKTRD